MDDKIHEPNTNSKFADDTTDFYKTVDEEIDKWMDDIVNDRDNMDDVSDEVMNCYIDNIQRAISVVEACVRPPVVDDKHTH